MLKDPAQRDKAAKALENIGDQAGDARVQTAAEKALDDAKAQQGQPADQGKLPDKTSANSAGKGPGDPTELKGNDPNLGKAGDATSDPGQPKADGGKGQVGPTGKNDDGKSVAANPDLARGGSSGADDPANRQPADERFNRLADELQLENLKKQVDKLRDKFTPKVMEKLNWTEQDREAFLRNMMADALKRQQRQKAAVDAPPVPGSLSPLLPGTGPRNLQADRTPDSGSVTADRPLAPPEVREAQKLYQKKG